MKKQQPTRGELERSLSQSIQALYREQLGHQPSKITCQIFDEKIAIILENSITPAEQVLSQEGQAELTRKVRSGLNKAIKPPLKDLIEKVLNVEVTDLLSDTTVETSRTGIIAVLNNCPDFRNPESIAKLHKKQ